MKSEWEKALQELREAGYAVTVFYPCELGGVSPKEVEEWMIDCVNQNLEIVQGESE